MAAVNTDAMALSPDQLNAMDQWLLDFLHEHEWGSPNIARRFYNDQQETESDEVSRQWVSSRLSRLAEHGHIEHVHPEADDYRLVNDPRENQDSE